MGADQVGGQPKEVMSAIAQAALAGIVAIPSKTDRGERVIVLSRGAWTREIRPADLAEALLEARTIARRRRHASCF